MTSGTETPERREAPPVTTQKAEITSVNIVPKWENLSRFLLGVVSETPRTSQAHIEAVAILTQMAKAADIGVKLAQGMAVPSAADEITEIAPTTISLTLPVTLSVQAARELNRFGTHAAKVSDVPLSRDVLKELTERDILEFVRQKPDFYILSSYGIRVRAAVAKLKGL